MIRAFLLVCVVCLCSAAGAAAQQPAAAPSPADAFTSQQGKWEQVEPGHQRFTEQVDLDLGGGLKLFADVVDYFTDDRKLVASGNVVFTNPEGRLSAERLEFNLADGTGTFTEASGIMTLPRADRTQFGNQDPDVYFYGERIDKLGPRRYRVAKGGFTTCVQPTPRWEMVSDSVVINLSDYAIAHNTVLRVKGVPLFYLPIVYYPIRNQERTTGFLLPTYGTSTIRGQAISNAFFWAIDRSQDATFFHDWFTKTGQGMGGEYRYAAGPRSLGNTRFYRFNQNETSYTQRGVTTKLDAKTIYQVTSAVTQQIGPAMRAQVNVDYFSDVFLQQLYHQNLYQATQRQRRISTALSGASGPLSAGVFYTRNEIFSSDTQSTVYGTTPRVTAALAPQRLFGTPIYGGVNADFSNLPNRSVTSGVTTSDTSLGRLDVAPSLRAPLSTLTFLSVNTTAGFRTTTYTQSADARGQLVPESITRQYFSTRTEAIGPVFTKIWDTPGSLSTERMKHVIEPTFALEYISGFDTQSSVPLVPSDPTDFVVGASSRFTYGLNNRLLYRTRPLNGVRGSTREFLTIGVQQTYYSNPESSRFDPNYVTSTSRRAGQGVTLSPVTLTGRLSPTTNVDSTTKVEYDVYGSGLVSLTSSGSLNSPHASSSVTYSRQHLPSASSTSNYVSGSATVSGQQLRGTYSLSWDIANGYVVSQSVVGSYMAQCCGLQFEFQEYHFPANSGYPVPSDRRFNFGFVLAGLGTFSNFFGAFGGLTR